MGGGVFREVVVENGEHGSPGSVLEPVEGGGGLDTRNGECISAVCLRQGSDGLLPDGDSTEWNRKEHLAGASTRCGGGGGKKTAAVAPWTPLGDDCVYGMPFLEGKERGKRVDRGWPVVGGGGGGGGGAVEKRARAGNRSWRLGLYTHDEGTDSAQNSGQVEFSAVLWCGITAVTGKDENYAKTLEFERKIGSQLSIPEYR